MAYSKENQFNNYTIQELLIAMKFLALLVNADALKVLTIRPSSHLSTAPTNYPHGAQLLWMKQGLKIHLIPLVFLN